jgi:hypothetical protein
VLVIVIVIVIEIQRTRIEHEQGYEGERAETICDSR